MSALLTIAGAVVLTDGSLSGANAIGAALIGLATLAWGIDNNISQRLSLRDPIQVAICKAAGPSLPMLLLAWLLGHPFPPLVLCLALLGIGALGYGISIWLDLLALRDLGAAREAVLFSTAPFVGAMFAVVVLRERFSLPWNRAAPASAPAPRCKTPSGPKPALSRPGSPPCVSCRWNCWISWTIGRSAVGSGSRSD